ncbi:MAG: hypothetical protein J2P49_11015 [Methylocapsa sp.]|nr:hypothetical protein [Methylocapsa sp.]
MGKTFGFGSLIGIAAPLSLFFAALALSGCARPVAPAMAAVAPGPARPAWPALPENAACTKDLNHYQALIDTDVSTGMLNRTVYDAIQMDMSRAAAACANGKNSEALAILRTTKVKHGYSASS